MFLYECALIRKKSDYEWTIALPIFLSNFKQIQSEDVFRTDLVLLVFTKSSKNK